jgi:hypothetical protein
VGAYASGRRMSRGATCSLDLSLLMHILTYTEKFLLPGTYVPMSSFCSPLCPTRAVLPCMHLLQSSSCSPPRAVPPNMRLPMIRSCSPPGPARALCSPARTPPELVWTVKHYFWNTIDYGFVIGFSRLSVARSWGGFSANSTKIYCYLVKSHCYIIFSKFCGDWYIVFTTWMLTPVPTLSGSPEQGVNISRWRR